MTSSVVLDHVDCCNARTMACYKFMAVDLTQAANRIEKDYKLRERRDFAEIVVIQIINRIGIHGTSSSVNASTLL